MYEEVMLLENYSGKHRAAVSEYFAEFTEAGENAREDVYGGFSYTFLYLRESDGRLTGMLNIRQDETAAEFGNIGYSVRPSERRKGYGTQLVEAAIELCKMFGIESPTAYTAEDNYASIRVLVKNGFVRIGKENGSGVGSGEEEGGENSGKGLAAFVLKGGSEDTG